MEEFLPERLKLALETAQETPDRAGRSPWPCRAITCTARRRRQPLHRAPDPGADQHPVETHKDFFFGDPPWPCPRKQGRARRPPWTSTATSTPIDVLANAGRPRAPHRCGGERQRVRKRRAHRHRDPEAHRVAGRGAGGRACARCSTPGRRQCQRRALRADRRSNAKGSAERRQAEAHPGARIPRLPLDHDDDGGWRFDYTQRYDNADHAS